MTARKKTYFEIGGELIELEADYSYGTGRTSAKRRKQQRAVAKDVKSIGKSASKIAKTSEGIETWGPAEQFGYGYGLGVGVIFMVATAPVVLADSPLIGPADLAWFAASMRMMDKATNVGRSVGAFVDDLFGFEQEEMPAWA